MLALGITDFLQDGLLGSLGTDTAKLDRLEWLFDVIVHLQLGIDLLGVRQHLLLVRLLQTGLVGHDQPAPEAFVGAGFPVDFHTDIDIILEALFHGRGQGALERGEHDITRYGFFTRQRIDQQ